MITLLPTKNRPKLLARFMESGRKKTKTEGFILVDENDFHENEEKYMAIKCISGWKWKLTKAVGMGDKVREVWPEVEGEFDAVNILNDDHVIISDNWDIRLMSRLDGTNFVTCNDNWTAPAKASGATVFSMPLLKAVGFPIFPPGMKHLFIDDLWEGLGRSTGCWHVDMGVTIEHRHAFKNEAEKDQTFYDVYGKGPDMQKGELWQNDHRVYREFMENQLNGVRNKIRVLRGQFPIVYGQ